jgi:hypothetical protein
MRRSSLDVPPAGHESQQAHEIGLVSLSLGEDPRYIGPSSGFFFANRIFNSAGRSKRPVASSSTLPVQASMLSAELLSTPASLPARKEIAEGLSSTYFQTVHSMYPFLHEPSHEASIDRVYESTQETPSDIFHVYMVLAIVASNFSRRHKIYLPVERYYTAAMQHLSYVCNEHSITGLQSLLLLMVNALYNPSCGINVWNLNYQCLATLMDLGLQRDVPMSSTIQISLLEQEQANWSERRGM